MTLPQDHRALVRDRGDQEHLPGLGAGAVQQFPVDRGGRQQPSRHRTGQRPRFDAALFTLSRLIIGGGDHWWLRVTGDHVGGVAAGRRVQRVTIHTGQDPPERPLAGHQVPAGQRVAPGAETAQDILRSPRGPLPDPGHTIVARHQSGAGGQDQDHDEGMP